MKQFAAILLIIFLASCTTPQRTAAPVDLNANVLYTQATSTAQAEAVMATQRAMIATKDRAAENAQITMQETAVSGTSTRSFAVTQSAIVAATATTSAFNREQIELEALTTRRHAETVATVTAVYLDSERNINNARRSNAGWWGFVVIFLILFFLFGYTLVRILNNRADFLYPIIEEIEDEKPIQITARVQGVRTRRSQSVDVELVRPPFTLEDSDGRAVHTFDGNALDNMQTNIERGDIGFRRGTSGENLGMDELAGIRGGDKYTPVLSAMKASGFVESVGMVSKWTLEGVQAVLGMDNLPQS